MARSRDLFANFERMRREIDELFGDVFERADRCGAAAASRPPVDVYYVDDPPRAVVRPISPGWNRGRRASRSAAASS